MSDAERQPYEQQHAMRRAEHDQAAAARAPATFQEPRAFVGSERFELPEPGPMLPPVPAVILGVAGDDEHPADLTVVWSFILDGPNAQIGIVGDDSMITFDEHAGLSLIRKHRCFWLNVPDAGWIDQFDRIDMTASTARTSLQPTVSLCLSRLQLNETPGIAEAAVVLECKVLEEHRLPPAGQSSSRMWCNMFIRVGRFRWQVEFDQPSIFWNDRRERGVLDLGEQNRKHRDECGTR